MKLASHHRSDRSTLRFVATVLGIVAVLTGCSGQDFAFLNENRSVSGALPVIENNAAFFKVDLIEALDPHRYGLEEKLGGAPTKQQLNESDKLELAFAGFYSPRYARGSQEQRRSELQDRLIASSNQACAEFKRHLHSFQSQTNFLLGSLTTAVAGAGAIVTPANTARLLSGTGAVFSGVRAEFNEDFFVKLTAGVITKAVDNRRTEILRDIQDRRAQPITQYTVQRAVADAIYYNDVCSLIEGLQIASTAVTIAEDPGLKRLSKVLKESGFKSNVRLDVSSESGEELFGATSAIGTKLNVGDSETAAIFHGRTKIRIGEATSSLNSRIERASKHAKATSQQREQLTDIKANVDKARTTAEDNLEKADLKTAVDDQTKKFYEVLRKAQEALDSTTRGIAEAELRLAVAKGVEVKAAIKKIIDSLLEEFQTRGLDVAKIEEALAKAS
jgi:hypothetical protein